MLAAAGVLLSALARAQSPTVDVEDHPAERSVSARVEVVLGVLGPLDDPARGTLNRLLGAELDAIGLALVNRDPSVEVREWAREVSRGERRLLAVLLDTRGSAGWRLVVIDAERGRAIARELPGGIEGNRASVEAVVSIVLSATNALREGLEVASAPVEAVVGPAAPPRAAPVKKASVSPAGRPPRAPRRGTSVRGSVSGVLASLAEASEPTAGMSLAVGVDLLALVEIDADASRHFPAEVRSPLGRFALTRTTLSLSVGPLLDAGPLLVVPQVGVLAEWLARSDTDAAFGVVAEEASSTQRTGGLLALRGRYALLERAGIQLLSLELGLKGAYFGRGVRFLAEKEVLAEARPVVVLGELGLAIATDPL